MYSMTRMIRITKTRTEKSMMKKAIVRRMNGTTTDNVAPDLCPHNHRCQVRAIYRLPLDRPTQ